MYWKGLNSWENSQQFNIYARLGIGLETGALVSRPVAHEMPPKKEEMGKLWKEENAKLRKDSRGCGDWGWDDDDISFNPFPSVEVKLPELGPLEASIKGAAKHRLRMEGRGCGDWDSFSRS